MLSGTAKQLVRIVGRDTISAPDVSLRAMVDACVSNVAVLDESGSIMYASKAWDLLERNVTGESGAVPLFEGCRRFTRLESNEQPDVSLADDIRSIVEGKQKEFHRKYYFTSLPELQPFVMHAARLNLPGSTFRVLITHEELPSVHGHMNDVSERERAEEALKALGGRLIAAQEEERRRVARELHDDFNQRLAVLSIELEQLGQKIQKPIGLRRDVQRLQDLAQEIAAEIHRLSYKLHPSKLDHLGLVAAVKSLCAELSESGKLNVEFQQSGFPFALDRDTTLCLFRIAQEGLRNCVKHSRAESARVVLMRTKNSVRLLVSDNGCGFNTKTALMEKGLGFVSMKERLHILGGEMNVYSKPLHGTRLEVSVPLKLDPNSPGIHGVIN